MIASSDKYNALVIKVARLQLSIDALGRESMTCSIKAAIGWCRMADVEGQERLDPASCLPSDIDELLKEEGLTFASVEEWVITTVKSRIPEGVESANVPLDEGYVAIVRDNVVCEIRRKYDR